MNGTIVDKLQRKVGVANLYESFVRALSFSEMQSFLIEVFDGKRKGISVGDVFRQYRDDPYVRPSTVDPKTFLSFDTLLFSRLPENVHCLELSPVSPLGCCSQIGAVSQKRIISTIRKSEVCSDPTNVLALEVSKRRKESGEPVCLAASQRLLRAEKTISKDTFPHFRVFSVCFADRDRGNFRFEVNACRELALFYDGVLSDLAAEGYSFSPASMVFMFHNRDTAELFREQLSGMGQQTGHLSLRFETDDAENWNYYSNVRFNLFISVEGNDVFISDGGDTDWTRKLLNNGKERYFISGLGSERMIAVLNYT